MGNSKEVFDSLISELHGKFDQLINMTKQKVGDVPGSTKGSGVYLFSDPANGDEYVYVGRAKNFGTRFKDHIALNYNKASFAFKVARVKTGIKPSYKVRGSRQDLLDNNP